VAVSVDGVEVIILDANGREIQRVHPDGPLNDWADSLGWRH
jgi:hypothetical protein